VTDTAIATRGLLKRYGKRVALDRVDLEVERGAALGLVGTSGAGKSTLVRVLAGLARPTAGSATILGAPVGSAAGRRRLGVLLQEASLYGWMRGREVLAFAADLARVGRPEVPARIAEVAGRFGVESTLNRRVSELPPSMQGRLGIAQAVVGDPEVLVLDEPFHWIDPEAHQQVLAALAALRGKMTVVVAAHRWADVRALCDRLVVLDAGRIVFDGATGDLVRRLASTYVVETSGAPGLALAGVVARLRAEPWITDVRATGGTLHVATSDPDRAARELLPVLVGAGVAVSAVRREEGSFEQLVAGLSRR
jgi:ABC-2 type transport system ATP-binding protein